MGSHESPALFTLYALAFHLLFIYTNLSFYRSKMIATPNRMTARPTGTRLKSSTEPTSCRFERSKIGSLLSKKWAILGYATTCFLLITMLAPVDATNQFQREMETHGIRRRLNMNTCDCGKARSFPLQVLMPHTKDVKFPCNVCKHYIQKRPSPTVLFCEKCKLIAHPDCK